MAGLLLAGCAEPGQLGHDGPQAPPAAGPVPAAQALPPPPPPTGTADIGRGTLPARIQLSTLGPADVSVRTVELAPGESTGWHRHPGFETTIVNSGEVTVQTAEECAPTRVGAGEAVFVPDAEPHVMRNDGALPAQLVVTQVLAPGAPDRSGVPAACGNSSLR
ncbi:cupin domain-containing protein [Pseudonocardia sp. N23]|uniref:cupin domain-containing protein n=1 Tax=Pseudonocardia sp. N23 TaxID=1987376 RepID=UPI000BFC2880|nr:cupin domain-containing protein [Pseudonocardia sp. N23]GAY08429.1 hypothetical protein TOK_1987 [Pseudonocardia sp. N23]